MQRHGGADLNNWVLNHDAGLLTEFAAGPLPDHHSNGAAEAALREVRQLIGNRAFCFRNAERTNRLLELARLRLNKVDDVGHYAAEIRKYLEAGGRLHAPSSRSRTSWGARACGPEPGVYLPSITRVGPSPSSRLRWPRRTR